MTVCSWDLVVESNALYISIIQLGYLKNVVPLALRAQMMDHRINSLVYVKVLK